jgi:hypothetical protein
MPNRPAGNNTTQHTPAAKIVCNQATGDTAMHDGRPAAQVSILEGKMAHACMVHFKQEYFGGSAEYIRHSCQTYVQKKQNRLVEKHVLFSSAGLGT